MIGPKKIPQGGVGLPYAKDLIGKQGVAPYSFHKQGKLPVGIKLSKRGTLQGTPGERGEFPFQVSVRDARGIVNTRSYKLIIR